MNRLKQIIATWLALLLTISAGALTACATCNGTTPITTFDQANWDTFTWER